LREFCLTGKSVIGVSICLSSPLLQKYSAFPVGQIISTGLGHPVPKRGALAIVTNVGAGSGGRGSVGARWDRRAGLLVSDQGAQTNDANADGKTVWSWPVAGVKSAEVFSGPTGTDKTLIRR
jgi:hypothetical protein